ncbi:MAG TPA: UDP-N-acetylmuramate dehydrogenase [Coriobacteriia bacterium]|nr:UDP-N-acetylmuramate dehydrogenase [Coriobacteriia bacterium]
MSVTRAYERLNGQLDGLVRHGESLSRHTSYRIGGPAALFVECASVTDLARVTEVLAEEGIEWIVLGKGTNVLASDEGYAGAVIVLGKEFKRHSVSESDVVAGAGVSLAALVQDAFGRGLTGLEFAVGVPGTFGGALSMNAGTREAWIGSVVEAVTVYQPGSGLVRLRGPEVPWGYRTSGLSRLGVVVEASLALEAGDEWRIRSSMEASLRRRKRSQPLSQPNAGSVFKNPEGESAGRLIETVGLKGQRAGGAQFSEVHANFIVNIGGARAADVVELMVMAQQRVRDEHGIELEPEIRFLGSFEGA